MHFAGAAVGWFAEKFLGPIDPHPIFDGMPDRARRSAGKRREFLDYRKKEAELAVRDSGEAVARLTGTERHRAVVKQYVAYSRQILFEAPLQVSLDDHPGIDDFIARRFARYMHESVKKNSVWFLTDVLDVLMADALFVRMAPTVLTPKFWEIVDAEQKSKVLAAKVAAQKAEQDRERKAWEQRNNPVALMHYVNGISGIVEQNFNYFSMGWYSRLDPYQLNIIAIALHLTGGDLSAAKSLVVRDYVEQYRSTGVTQTTLNADNYPAFSNAYRNFT